jgi:2'-5' RNA ligase
MIYALVHYPNVDTKDINQLRMKYDPQVELIGPHITLMFPVSESIGEENLVHHLENVLNSWQSFPIHLQRFQISSDDHLFLLLQEGNANIIRLHGEIYTGILADYRREDIPFIPHLTLGVLNKDSNEHDRVLIEAKHLGIHYYCVLDKLRLAKVNDDRSKIVWGKEFSLAE